MASNALHAVYECAWRSMSVWNCLTIYSVGNPMKKRHSLATFPWPFLCCGKRQNWNEQKWNGALIDTALRDGNTTVTVNSWAKRNILINIRWDSVFTLYRSFSSSPIPARMYYSFHLLLLLIYFFCSSFLHHATVYVCIYSWSLRNENLFRC